MADCKWLAMKGYLEIIELRLSLVREAPLLSVITNRPFSYENKSSQSAAGIGLPK